MTKTPGRKRKRLPGISSRAYEHPADRGALVALRSLSGVDTVFRKLSGVVNERSLRLAHLSSAVRVGEGQFRDLYDYVRDAAYALDLEDVPEVYVTQSPFVTAMTIGSDRPFIVISSGLVDLLDAEELRFVVGHEVGHALSGHAVYRTMLVTLTQLALRVAWFPMGYLGLRAIVMALEEWQRKSELSCDRAGLLASQDPDAAKRALMKAAGGAKLSEMSTEAFLEQARDYESAGDARDSVLKLINLLGSAHPAAVIRVAELDRWAREGEYKAVLAGKYPRRADDRKASISEEAANAARSYRESWNRSTDPLFSGMRDAAGSA
ncbi:MAG: M48 family metallopeptidase, partial [Actinobacteria bacterium]|nr:M48 family metallopeptidase [Actinomycetota bacterium]